MTVYGDYQRERVGWFFGLTGGQLAVLVVAMVPVPVALNRGAWATVVVLLGVWLVVFGFTVIPVRGRSATGWVAAVAAYTVGGVAGWTRFRSRAAVGRPTPGDEPDLPGRLAGIEILDGPPTGSEMRRVAIIKDHATRTYAVTAAVVHPGVVMSDADERRLAGEGLSVLLDVAERTRKIDEVIAMVRTVPDDGAERQLWVDAHRRSTSPDLSALVNHDMATGLVRASVRTEQFVTFCVPESRLAKEAKRSGRGFEGRARVLHQLMAEVEAQLKGAVGMSSVRWMTSPELALACRTGFAPGDRASIVRALAQADRDRQVNASVSMAMAGPSGADPAMRHYSHDAWNSISSTLKLPAKGAVMGALAPVLTPGAPGERRSLVVSYPIVAKAKADRQTGNAEWAADMAEGIRSRLGMKPRAQQREDAAKARKMDAKLHTGNAQSLPYAVVTVTVPKTYRIGEFGGHLDIAIRGAGFEPLRLDVSQDVAFCATCVPLGVGLTRSGDA